MSTKERFGTLVWRALNELYSKTDASENQWITVGEVSEDVGISKVTARKYLEELAKLGHASFVRVGSSVGYRPIAYQE